MPPKDQIDTCKSILMLSMIMKRMKPPATVPENLFLLSPVLTQDRAEWRGLTLELGPTFSQSSPLYEGDLSLFTLQSICEVPDTQKQTIFSSFLTKK